jgi:CBS domain-containing protein
MRVGDLMRPDVLSTFPQENMADAAQRMRDHEVGALVVMDQGTMLGIVTERDLLTAITAGLAPRVTAVSSCMTADPVTADPDMGSDEAATLMVENGIRHLPVIQHAEVIGMLSARDLLTLEAWPTLHRSS